MKSFEQLANNDLLRNPLEEALKAHSEMSKGIVGEKTPVHISDAVQARKALELSQNEFAQLLGISVRTLQEWEQLKRNPSKSAQMLLKVAINHPTILKSLN